MKRLSIYTFLTLLFCVSCTNELEQLPETKILANNYYTTEESVEATVTASYNSLQELYDYYMILWGEIPSDNTYIQAPNSNGGASPLEDFTWTSTTGFTNSIWENAYEGILYSNIVLEVIDDITYENETLKTVRKGEMKLIRAFLYDHLITMYADVPLILTTEDPVYAFNDERTPKKDIQAQIEKDLLEAITELPETNSSGRVDKYVANAILAKHYMKQQSFDKAEAHLATIVNSGKYNLVGIDELFGVENEGNTEDVFSVQFASGLDGNSEGSGYYYSFTQPDDNGGRGAMAMEPSMYAAYETNDLRKNLINKSGNVYYINKWTPSPNSNTGDGGDNHYIVRYADVLLLYAECLNENGKTTQAAFYLNQVRNRAGLANTNATTQVTMQKAIALERKFELVGEGHRWIDLLRTNMAIQTMNTFFQEENKGITVEEFRLLAPIPQSEIDITKMKQNPGY
ncbi:MAG: RagB/SusD family nutrient uptake outer membrane protein [Mesonia hippocampi]|uniref:RagB/SusD family nutrient uptake outer membrane protein n=1 Tax=Mesonia hippocampi TaxID=1628250 RepID=UPI003F9AF413